MQQPAYGELTHARDHVNERRLVILDSVVAARRALESKAVSERDEVLATHCSLIEFLALRGIRCRDVSDYFTAEQVAASIAGAAADLEIILRDLDGSLGAHVCVALGLPRMAIFTPAFKYLGQYQLAGVRLFERVVAERLKAGIGACVFYHSLPGTHGRVFSLVGACERACGDAGVAFADIEVEREAPAEPSVLARSLRLARRALKSPFEVARLARQRLHMALARVSRASSTPSAIVFRAGLVSFFTEPLHQLGVSTMDARQLSKAALRSRAIASEGIVERIRGAVRVWRDGGIASNPLTLLLADELARHAEEWFVPLVHAHRTIEACNVRVVAWDLPVVTSVADNLIVELGLATDLQVFGRQHGANYGHQNLGSIHFDSDFNRCTRFFSYGFGPREFAATYPGRSARCEILPAGGKSTVLAAGASDTDIAYPITNCMPVELVTRLPEAELMRRQTTLIDALVSRSDLRCVLKLPPNANFDTFAHMERVKRLTGVRYETTPWSEFLEQHRPSLVVLDVVSTPLFEVIELDVDLFIMLDPIFPFESHALEMLRRRAHVFDDAEALAAAIRSYDSSQSEKLRDSEFARTFVNGGSRESAFQSLAASAPGLWPARMHRSQPQ